MRNMATIQTIKSVEPIPGKDRIVYASFKNVGFRVIVQSTYKPGDRVIYCEVDTLLPPKPEFEFLKKTCSSSKWEGYRIRNMKMAGVYSEGLVLPVDTDGTPDGYDVSELIGATKYDPESAEEQKLGKPEKKSGAWYSFLYRFNWIKKLIEYFRPVCKYSWPEWASKSDETRVQNLNYVYQKYQGQRFYATEKLDGQSCLYAIHKGKFYVGSRNLLLARPGRGIKSNNYWDFALKHDIEAKMRKIRKEVGRDFYIQGELCGPGIQGNKYALREKEFFAYNMRLIGANRYVARHAIEAILGRFRIKTAPLLGLFTWKFGSIDELLKYADGTSVITPGVLREGVVIRSCDDRGPDTGQSNQLSFKVISPSFDLKWSAMRKVNYPIAKARGFHN